MIHIAYSDRPAHLAETRERSDEPVIVIRDSRSYRDVQLDSVGITLSSDSLFAVIEFEMREIVEPDTDIPKTLAELAEEQRIFTAELEGYVDIDLPFDN